MFSITKEFLPSIGCCRNKIIDIENRNGEEKIRKRFKKGIQLWYHS